MFVLSFQEAVRLCGNWRIWGKKYYVSYESKQLTVLLVLMVDYIYDI